MKEKLSDRIARELAVYLFMSCSSDALDSMQGMQDAVARFLRMEFSMIDRTDDEFERIGEAVGDPIGASFGRVAEEVVKMAVREEALRKALGDLYDTASNGALSDDPLCMQEAGRLLDEYPYEKGSGDASEGTLLAGIPTEPDRLSLRNEFVKAADECRDLLSAYDSGGTPLSEACRRYDEERTLLNQ